MQQQLVREIFTLLSKRSDSVCNFLEGGRCVPVSAARRAPSSSSSPRRASAPSPSFRATSLCFSSSSVCSLRCASVGASLSVWGSDVKLIYRHYATLYFVFAVDQQESELGILDLVQVFVEALDKRFENVCELDLIFHSDRVHYILDEIVMGGMVLETNIGDIIEAVVEMDKLESSTKGLAIRG